MENKLCKCGKPCILKDRMFVYHDGFTFTGWVCEPCNALYVNDDDSIFDYDIKVIKARQKVSNLSEPSG